MPPLRLAAAAAARARRGGGCTPLPPPLLLLLLLLALAAAAAAAAADALHNQQPPFNTGGAGKGKPPLPSKQEPKPKQTPRAGARLLGAAGDGSGDGNCAKDAMLDLGRLFKEQEEKEIARLAAQEQVRAKHF